MPIGTYDTKTKYVPSEIPAHSVKDRLGVVSSPGYPNQLPLSTIFNNLIDFNER
jgi:hypothetical protein